jgi:lipoprotein-anchoring transpeptidase ErfK/SrfK
MFFKKLVVFLLLFFGVVFAEAHENQMIFPEKLETKKIPKLILVSLEEQALANYHYGELVSCFPISSGREERPTPVGEFKIINKTKMGFSTRYNSPMPWAMSLNKLYAIHAGELPGYPDSHGCVRLSDKDAEELYNWAEIGTSVWIIRSLESLTNKK